MKTKFGIAICKHSLLNKYGDLYLLDGDIIMYFRLNENGFITVYKDLDYMEPVIHKLSTNRFERVFEEISEPYLLCNQDAGPLHFKFKKGMVFHYKNGLFLNVFGDKAWEPDNGAISYGERIDTANIFKEGLYKFDEIFEIIDKNDVEKYQEEYKIKNASGKFGI
jgi:hypothetical protein